MIRTIIKVLTNKTDDPVYIDPNPSVSDFLFIALIIGVMMIRIII